MCRILRHNKVKITRYVKKKLAKYDKYLQGDYEMIRVKFMETVTIAVNKDATGKNVGRKPTKVGQK